MAKALTAVAVEKARPTGVRREIPDGGCRGLHLVVQPTGGKSWAVRYRFRGHPTKLTLGPALVGEHNEPAEAPEIGTPLSLAAARELATRALRQAKGGTDPAAARRKRREEQRAAEADTLEAVCEEYLRREGPRLRSREQRRSDLELLYPTLGRLPIDQIRRSMYVRLLDRIADERGPVRSDRVLAGLSRLLSWHSKREENFTSPLPRGGLRKVAARDMTRTRVLDDGELRTLWTTAETFSGPFGRYLQFLLLTACRRTEAAAMRRGELLSPDTWIIPAARCKTGKDTLIPLSHAAQAIVEAQPRLGDFVFTIYGNRPLGGYDAQKQRFDAASGLSGWRIHDLRRTSRTLLSRAGVNADVAERCLGHALEGVRATYDRHSFENEKRVAFEKLAAQIERIVHPPEATVADLATERGRRR